MKTAAMIAAICLAALVGMGEEAALAAESARTNIVSNVETVKGWSRQYVFVGEDGTLHDRSGRLVEYGDEVARSRRADDVLQVTEAARDGMTNALQRVYDLTNQVPERGVSLRFSMKPGAGRGNFYAYEVAETSDGTNDVATYYFSRTLAVPPKIQRRYRNAEQTVFANGEWLDYSTNGVTVVDAQGVSWGGCNRIRFARPAWAWGYPARPNRHCVIGHPASGLDFAGAMVFVDGLPTFTGYVTNGSERAYFDNGVYKGSEEVEE